MVNCYETEFKISNNFNPCRLLWNLIVLFITIIKEATFITPLLLIYLWRFYQPTNYIHFRLLWYLNRNLWNQTGNWHDSDQSLYRYWRETQHCLSNVSITYHSKVSVWQTLTPGRKNMEFWESRTAFCASCRLIQ